MHPVKFLHHNLLRKPINQSNTIPSTKSNPYNYENIINFIL